MKMESIKDLKRGDLVAHRSKLEVTMVVYAMFGGSGLEKPTDATIHCRWLSSLNEPQDQSFRLFELKKI